MATPASANAILATVTRSMIPPSTSPGCRGGSGSGQAELPRLGVGNVDHHAEQRGREHLALRVGLERQRSAAVERAVQQKVQRSEIRQLVTLYVAGDHATKVVGHSPLRDLAHEQRIPLTLERDHADVGRVTLVTGSRVRDVDESHLHPITSTAVCTSVLSISAGQYAAISSTFGRPPA